MRKSKQVFLISGMALTMVFSGCSNLPQEMIDAANTAIDSAKTAGADIYASESFSALQDSMMVAMEKVESAKSKFIKNYSESEKMLEKVSTMAGEAKIESENRIESMKAEIQSAVEETKRLITENNQLVSEAPRGKEGTSALAAIRNEISMIETSLAEVADMFDNGDYIAANGKSIAAKEKALDINVELKEVIAKYKSASAKR